MFSHIIELTAGPGQTQALIDVIINRAVPEIIQFSEGFVDEIVLASYSDPARVLAISFWNSKADADAFFESGFSQVSALTAPFLAAKPGRQEFTIGASTNAKIVTG